jgi:hypothetical protein
MPPPKRKVRFAAELRFAFYRCPELDETALGKEILVHAVSWACDSFPMTNL